MRKLLIFIGTRPEAIKLAPLVVALKEAPDKCAVSVCLSSQHKEMLSQALRWFPDVRADDDMDVMRDNQGLADVAAALLRGAQAVIGRLRPDIVVVQGDTTTAFACALAAFYAGVQVAHVEAGLRSGNPRSPWPEEINRVLISRLATFHFAPTKQNAANLHGENAAGYVHVVGNTVIDALLSVRRRLDGDDSMRATVTAQISDAGYTPRKGRDFILVTGHRRESFGKELENICGALAAIAADHPALDVVYSVHLNPRVRETVYRLLSSHERVFLLPPLDYGAFVLMMDACRLILTDSGGIQEEAPSLDKPVLVMRNETERHEVLKSGAARLTGTKTADIIAATRELLKNKNIYQQMATAHNPFGDGCAAQHIRDILISN